MRYSLLLAGICVLAFIVQSALPGFTDSFALISSQALWSPWMFVTSIFLHGSLSHLFFNMFALVLFGLMLESFIGSRKFLALFFVSGIIASLASFFVYPASLGASGAIYGIIGCLAVIRPKMIVWTYGAPMPMVAAAGFYLLLDLGGLFFPSNVANAAHIGGLAAGVVAGLIVREPGKRTKKEKVLSEKEINDWEDNWMS